MKRFVGYFRKWAAPVLLVAAFSSCSGSIDKEDLPPLDIPDGSALVYGAEPGADPVAITYDSKTGECAVYRRNFERPGLAEMSSMALQKRVDMTADGNKDDGTCPFAALKHNIVLPGCGIAICIKNMTFLMQALKRRAGLRTSSASQSLGTICAKNNTFLAQMAIQVRRRGGKRSP